MNKTKKKQISRYREQIRCLPVGRGKGEGQYRGTGLKKRVTMGLHEIMFVKPLKIIKHYRIKTNKQNQNPFLFYNNFRFMQELQRQQDKPFLVSTYHITII